MRPFDLLALSVLWGTLAACEPSPGLTWVPIPGGTFEMGSDSTVAAGNEQPPHEVTVAAFEITETEITVRQFRVCMEAGKCSAPHMDDPWAENYPGFQPGNDDYPIAFVSWHQAREYCKWAGGRLPTEAEWEYAARSAGQPLEYPWGSAVATCERAVMFDQNTSATWGCGADTPLSVCSRPLGNTEHGLCDMAGNVFEWVEDDFHSNYEGSPRDGSAWVDSPRGPTRVLRGGNYGTRENLLRTMSRSGLEPDWHYIAYGFRCAR